MAQSFVAEILGEMPVKEIVPCLCKSRIEHIDNHFGPVGVIPQAIIFMFRARKVHTLARESLLYEDTLPDDFEFQHHEKFQGPDEVQEQRHGSFMSFNLAPLHFHISGSECLVNPDKFRDVGPVSCVEKKQRKQPPTV